MCAGFLGEYLEKIRFCVARLDEGQVWWRPARGSNSVGNLLLHLAGNLRQWVLSALAGEPDARRRSAEFAEEGGSAPARDDLLAGLAEVVGRVQGVMRGLGPRDLERAVRVQGYDTTGLGVVLHVTEHMSYHAGQVVFVAKQLLGEPAGIDFYRQHRGE
jgi:uncharacterized damage-inducible protein DinB